MHASHSALRRFCGFAVCSAVLAAVPACAAPATAAGEDVEGSSDELTGALLVQQATVVGAITANGQPTTVSYGGPERFRAVSLSITTLEATQISLDASNGQVEMWVLDATLTIVHTAPASPTIRMPFRPTAPGRHLVVFRERRSTPTQVTVSCKPTPPPPPPPPPPAAMCMSSSGRRDIPEGGLCNWEVQNSGSHSAGVCTRGSCQPGCFIDGLRRPIGVQNPANPCEICDVDGGGFGRESWTPLRNGYQSYYPTCQSCSDAMGKLTVPPGAACYDRDRSRAGVCTAGACKTN